MYYVHTFASRVQTRTLYLLGVNWLVKDCGFTLLFILNTRRMKLTRMTWRPQRICKCEHARRRCHFGLLAQTRVFTYAWSCCVWGNARLENALIYRTGCSTICVIEKRRVLQDGVLEGFVFVEAYLTRRAGTNGRQLSERCE